MAVAVKGIGVGLGNGLVAVARRVGVEGFVVGVVAVAREIVAADDFGRGPGHGVVDAGGVVGVVAGGGATKVGVQVVDAGVDDGDGNALARHPRRKQITRALPQRGCASKGHAKIV